MCILIYIAASVWNISRSKKNWARYDKKNINWYSYKVVVIFVRF